MKLNEIEINVFYVANDKFIIIKNTDSDGTELINSQCLSNGCDMTIEEQDEFFRLMEQSIDKDDVFELKEYKGDIELLIKYFDSLDVVESNGKFYGLGFDEWENEE